MVGQGIIAALERRVPEGLRDDLDTRRRSMLALGVAGTLAVLCVPVAAVVFIAVGPGDRMLATVNTLLTGLLAGATEPLLRRGGLVWAAHWLAGLLFVGTVFGMRFGGGMFAPFVLLLPLTAALAAIVGGPRSGITWACACVSALLAFQVLGDPAQLLRDVVRVAHPDLFATVMAVMTIVLLTVFVVLSETTKREAIVQIAAATRRVEEATRDEQRARDLAAEAVAANAAKSAFLATMSHELRTPLNVILGYSEMALEDLEERGDDRVVEDLRRVHGAGQQLLGLISDVLDLSRIEAERLDLGREPFDLAAMIDELVTVLRPLATRNETRLITQESANMVVAGLDRARVRQIVHNLVSNAIKFTRRGEVRVQARTTATGLEISVQDTGIGIAPDKLELIFLPFTQADPSRTRRYEGSGLGLAISRRLCEVMGGTLSVTSAPGRGSTFVVRLPCTPRPM